jgi:hypothetical protein
MIQELDNHATDSPEPEPQTSSEQLPAPTGIWRVVKKDDPKVALPPSNETSHRRIRQTRNSGSTDL